MKKVFSVLGATAICLSLSGCIKDTTDLTIDRSDKISGTAYFGTLAVPPDPNAQPSSNTSCTPTDYNMFSSAITNLRIEDVCESGYIGKKYTFTQTPISDFNANTKANHGFSLNRVGTTLNLDGSFDFSSDQLKGLISSGDDVHFSFTFIDPVTATNGTLSNGDKTVTWNFTEDKIYTLAATAELDPNDSRWRPEISGTMQVGRTLEAGLRNFSAFFGMSYEEWFASNTQNGPFTVIWLRNGTEIPGAGHGLTYTLTPSDLNSKIAVLMMKPPYVLSRSIEYQILAPGIQTLTPVPTISGVIQVGSTVTAIPGNWDDGVAKSYVWRRNGMAISGAVNSTYMLRLEDDSQSLTVEVTGNKTGYVSASQSSIPVIVQPEPEPPMISGLARVGSTLRATSGDWPDGTNIVYSWRSRTCPTCSTSVIPGSAYNRDAFTLSAGQLGRAVQVCVSDAASVLPARCSTHTTVVALGTLSASPVPTISGTGKKGTPLSIVTGTWQPRVTFTYQWTRNGTPISGARGPTYRVTQSDIRAQLNVKVTGSLNGYKPVTRTAARYVTGRN